MRSEDTEHREQRRRMGQWARGVALSLLGTGLLIGCSSPGTPQSGTAPNPYAGGVTHPWSDRLDAPGADPYAAGHDFSWTGVRTATPGVSSQALSSGQNLLSDLSYTSATNGWGPLELDRSNNEQGAGDGQPLRIGTQTFAKGLGVHADSELHYTLTSSCSSFSATIGIDEEVGDRGSVVFQVYSGTTKLFDSGVVRGSDAPRPITVPLNGVSDLRLVVTNGGDNIDYDHADWAQAAVQCDAPPPPSDTSALSALSPTSASNGWGPVEKNQSNGEQRAQDGRPLTLNGVSYATGLGVHAGSSLTYALGGRCSVFSAKIGVDDEVGDRGSVTFQVYGDGTAPLYDSGVMTGASATRNVNVDLSGQQLLRLVVTNGGDNIDYDHADWANAQLSCGPADTAPPAAPRGLQATASTSSITLDWSDNPEADLAGYRVLRSGSAAGPFVSLTPRLLTASAYTDSAAPQGVTSYYQVLAVDQSGNASAPVSTSAKRPGQPVAARIALENRDGGPFQDRLVFNRIGSLNNPPGNGVHERATLRISNTGNGVLQITALTLTGAFVLESAPALPTTVAAGGVLDVRVRFTAQSGQVHSGTLSVASNDPDAPSIDVQLAGLWQSESENNKEPSLERIVEDGFGLQTSFAPDGDLNQQGHVAPQGDEIIAPYWQRADPAQPIRVSQLAAYHTQGNTATLRWFTKGGSDDHAVLTHAGIDGQSVLPRLNGSSSLAATTFSPSATTFGFKVDAENSDPALNDQSKDIKHGCAAPCGHHVRAFVARDRSGQVMPHTYLLVMDYAGINYDYNDNVYLISNLRPAPILIDVGTAAGDTFTDPDGNVWLSDRNRNNVASFTPNTAINEPAGGPNPSLNILNTANDTLYRTYRGNVGGASPRAISFQFPLENGPHQLRLHFADLAHTAAGKRIFDVLAEGQVVIPGLDIVAQAGGGNTALVKTVGLNVTDGLLNLTLNASVDYPSIAGIEIVR